MFARLSADADLIRAHGRTLGDRAVQLRDAAAALAGAGDDAAAAFGAVGARFLAALRSAAGREAQVVGALSDTLETARGAASDSARAYEAADGAAGDRIAGRR
ncbi:ESX-1 secretion-associated protein [Mycobacterium sp. Y57]|uniref:type VII secretion target n=1 Tax=Mycolicibacterium xanthum TaxID=2796469 RepID=UPI001C84C1C7|nr:type VII secretion target [Mycolicibacterium xanthum]MBX7433019.1 ESX-1 secretion-associated protein [Mycolicibacterium xanthum]